MADTQTIEQRRQPAECISIEQFLEWQEEDIHAEWVEGKVLIMSPTSLRHQEIVRFLTYLIGLFAETQNLGTLINAPFSMRLDTGPSVREPDLLFICTENLNRLKKTHLDGPADIAVEIISPESIGRDRGDKFVEYEQAGIPEYWLIDPIRERAEFYHLNQGCYHLAETPNHIYHSRILPDFWLNIEWLWQDPLPNALDILRQLKVL